MRFLILFFVLLTLPVQAEELQAFRGFKRLKDPIPVSTLQMTAPEGSVATLGQFKGKWILMNTWASWCAPCVAELPMFNKLAKTNPYPDLQIIAVSFDAGKSQEQIKDFLKKHQISDFAAYMDVNHGLEQKLKAQGLPVTYLVNPAGYVVADYRGGTNWMDPKALQALSFFINSGSTSNKSATIP